VTREEISLSLPLGFGVDQGALHASKPGVADDAARAGAGAAQSRANTHGMGNRRE